MIPGIKTKQDLFNHVATHLMTQMDTSYDDSGMDCMYHATDGKKCAVGCLIDDEHYDKSIECCGLTRGPVLDAVEASIGREIDGRRDHRSMSEYWLLKRLQVMHDTDLVSDWEKDLKNAARDFNLQLPAILEEKTG